MAAFFGLRFWIVQSKIKAMTIDPTNQIYQALLTAYDHFNRDLFESRLPPTLITVQRKANAMGYVSPKRWKSASGAFTDELAVNPEFFLGYPLLEVLQTLVHEQCHVFQGHYGEPGRRGYHNKEWADLMESIGLMPSSTGKPGGARTGESMGDYAIADGLFYKSAVKLIEGGFALPWLDRCPRPSRGYSHAVYDSNGAPVAVESRPGEAILVAPLGAVAGASVAPGAEAMQGAILLEPALIPGRKPTRIKYSCGCSNVWGRPGLNITCDDCGESFKEK